MYARPTTTLDACQVKALQDDLCTIEIVRTQEAMRVAHDAGVDAAREEIAFLAIEVELFAAQRIFLHNKNNPDEADLCTAICRKSAERALAMAQRAVKSAP